MSKDIYTVVSTPGATGWACRGRKTRLEAIAEARVMFEHTRDEAQRNLDAIENGTVDTVVQRGYHSVEVIEVLK